MTMLAVGFGAVSISMGSRVMVVPGLLEGELVVDDERRMVGEALLEVDVLAPGERRDAGRREVVVEPPADVLRPRLAAVAPPGVLLGMRVERAEDVDEAELLEQARHPGALLGQEAAVLAVALPVPEVDLLVRDVDVADDDHLPLPAELFQARRHPLEEAEFRRLAVLARRAA